jgi:hypothetical protein
VCLSSPRSDRLIPSTIKTQRPLWNEIAVCDVVVCVGSVTEIYSVVTWCVFSDVECIESGHELSHNRAQYSPCLFQPLSMIARPPQNILQLQQTQPDLASLLIL